MNQSENYLVPVSGAWVLQRQKDGSERSGKVLSSHTETGENYVLIKWQGAEESVASVHSLSSGFKVGMDVQDIPRSLTRKPLGEGVVVKNRMLGGRSQVLVDFPLLGKQLWLPYENLKQIKNVKHRFILGQVGAADDAERFRLKSLAYALEMWNENTGSLSHLDIDPLPHQIHLVHRILASGNLNWMIADDVGLGKTIETGMLLSALKQRGTLNRVLLITPAGLTKQWQEELNSKFGMGEFRIFGEDFFINESRHWKMEDHVIASIDRLKDERNLESLQAAGKWDMVIFDEAHRLSRRQYGLKLDASQRFELAATLRNNTDAMVLLTATPHQGMQDKFQSLLELLRPERKDQITTLSLNPEVISDMVYRNNKSDVTDADGNFIFKGKTTKAISVDVSEESIAFDEELQDYLRRGYAAGAELGVTGNAIGFVMTIYRKLSASSVAAILNALKNRKRRIEGRISEGLTENELSLRDQRFFGEWEEQLLTEAKEFFDGELQALDKLIEKAEKLKQSDNKIRLFVDGLLNSVLENNKDEKVLIFTEYRSTQDYIKEALDVRLGGGKVDLINGSMNHQLRRDSIARFEESGQFLISTEAGGEGINLQSKCHIMVNYDLPWNPMRLVQRIGRLYRYGQKKRVVVFNVHSPGTADEQIMQLMYTRIDQVVGDMATISAEFNEQLQDDILGEMADLLDVGKILQEATTAGIDRTKKRIDEALAKAQDATAKQRELFEYASSFDPGETRYELKISKEHSAAFVLGMFDQLGIDVVEKSHNGLLWHIRLPESVQKAISSTRTRYEVTLDRILAVNRPGTYMLDLDSSLMKYLINTAKSYEFMGLSAVIRDEKLRSKVILTSLLRWQNEQGQRMRQEYTAYSVTDDGEVNLNLEEFSEWLKHPATSSTISNDREKNKTWFMKIDEAAQKRLAEMSNGYLHPENNQWISSSWVVQ